MCLGGEKFSAAETKASIWPPMKNVSSSRSGKNKIKFIVCPSMDNFFQEKSSYDGTGLRKRHQRGWDGDLLVILRKVVACLGDSAASTPRF